MGGRGGREGEGGGGGTYMNSCKRGRENSNFS